MKLDIHSNHRLLFLLPASLYLVLVLATAVLPAISEAEREATMEKQPLPADIAWGREIYRTEENCTACHTQQIRGDQLRAYTVRGEEVVPVLRADARFGLDRPTRWEDYAHLEAPMLGTQRTGPDLMAVGDRLGTGPMWHYWHLYAPRSVSPGSTMEAYPWLFSTTKPEAENGIEPEPVELIDALGVDGDELWATPKAVALTRYLLSLRRPITKSIRVPGPASSAVQRMEEDK